MPQLTCGEHSNLSYLPSGFIKVLEKLTDVLLRQLGALRPRVGVRVPLRSNGEKDMR